MPRETARKEKERDGEYHTKPIKLFTSKQNFEIGEHPNKHLFIFLPERRTSQQAVNCSTPVNFTNNLYSKSHQNISEIFFSKLRLTFQTTSCMYLLNFIHYNILPEI